MSYFLYRKTVSTLTMNDEQVGELKLTFSQSSQKQFATDFTRNIFKSWWERT